MTVIQGFGDSNLTSAFVSLSDLYIEKYAAILGATVENHAVSGDMAADQSWHCYGATPGDSIFGVGTNDAAHYGDDAVKREQGFVPFLRGLVGWQGLPNKIFARDPAMTKAGVWMNTPANPVGCYANSPLSACACTVSGETVFIFGVILNSVTAEGRAEIRIDGVTRGYVEMKGTQVGSSYNGLPFGMGCWIFGGLSAGSHYVQAITTNSNSFFLDAIAGSDQPSMPTLLVGDVPRRYPFQDTDENIDLYCAAATTVMHELYCAGLNIVPFSPRKIIDPVFDLFPDGIHFRASGHDKLLASII